VDGHCFAGSSPGDVPFDHQSTTDSELARTRGKNLELYLTTRDAFSSWLPNVCANVTFINFATTINYLHYFIKERIFSSERPTEHKLNKSLRLEQQKIEAELTVNEQALLEVLNTNENILENEDVTKQLDKLKQKSLDLQQKEEAQSAQFKVITGILESYDKVVSKIVQV